MNIDDIDFRLLELLDALLRHRNVSKAAESLKLPQSSASHGLNRLRLALGDPLLVRTRTGMEATPRAEGLAPLIEQMLRLRQEMAGAGQTFLPDRMEREFVIAGSDIGQIVVLPALYRAVEGRYPGLRFRALMLGGDAMVSALQTGHADLAFGAYPTLRTGMQEQTLYAERYLCFVAPNHPLANGGGMEAFRKSDHVVAAMSTIAHAHREVEQIIAGVVQPHQLRVVAASFLVPLVIAARSSLVYTAPARILGELAGQIGLVGVEPPLSLPGFAVKQYWHVRYQHDPAHRWLRRTLQQSLTVGAGALVP